MSEVRTPPTHLIVGPSEHGVTRYALQLAEMLGAPILRFQTAAELEDALSHGARIPRNVHLHVTDHLFGATPAEAAALVHRIGGEGRSLTLTLHDIPQPADGEGRFERRARGYAALISAASLVIVNSRHEAQLLAEARILPRHIRDERIPVRVIPLPLIASRAAKRPEAPETTATLGIFGYVYPGKGIEEVIDAAALQPAPCRVVVLGAVAKGHDWLARELHHHAAERQVDFTITGFIDERSLPEALAEVTVPIAWHQHVSASGSINSWIAAGRRPIVADSRYAREIADLHHDAVTVPTRPLPEAIAAAIQAPETTRLPSPAGGGHGVWSLRSAAEAYARTFADTAVPTPDLSVIIPFFDDGTLTNTPLGPAPHTLARERLQLILRACLRAAQGQEASFEVIVVDDGSPADTAWLSEADLDAPLTIARQPDRGFRAGAARNLGASLARGRVLAFLDGDTVPEPGYLHALTHPILMGDADVTVGHRAHRALTGSHAGKRFDDPAWLRDGYARTDNLADADERAYQLVISAVMAVRSATFSAIGGFDETLRAYGGEDWHIAWRAWQAGATLRHIPAAVAVHDGPDWAGRAGRSDPQGLAVKNAETLALAERIAAHWARPSGVRFLLPELTVDATALDTAILHHPEVIHWFTRLLDVQADIAVRVRNIPSLFAGDGRMRTGSLPWSRWRLRLCGQAAADLPDIPVVLKTMTELDEAPESGPHGAAQRRARFVRTAVGRPESSEESGPTIATLISARASALEQLAGEPQAVNSGLLVSVPSAPALPDDSAPLDLERRWAGW